MQGLYTRRDGKQLITPLRDPVQVNVGMLRPLDQCLANLGCSQSHFRPEYRPECQAVAPGGVVWLMPPFP